MNENALRSLAVQLGKLEGSSDPVSITKGEVAAVVPGSPPTLTITYHGASTPGVRYDSSYLPQVGDVVRMLKAGGEFWVIGTSAKTSTPPGAWTATMAMKSGDQALTGTSTELAGCSASITTFVPNAIIQITASLDTSVTGSSDIGIVSAQVASTTLSGDLNFQGVGRNAQERSWLHTVASPGTYTVRLTGWKIGTADSLSIMDTHSRMIVSGTGFTF